MNKDRRKIGINNKRKGNNCERKYRLIFRDLGFTHCETSRYASKLLDACKIDLVNLPFNLQIKAGKQKNMNPGKELSLMFVAISENLTAEFKSLPCFLLHEKEVLKGKRRTEDDTIVYFSLKQFNEFKDIDKNLVFQNLKVTKAKINLEFKSIVSVSFQYFIANILPIITENGNRNR